ncbi:MAG: DEAD/DEAH box helicase [Treponema sp.]|nr:DEAD/DEAH box helicase [Treponema sp.]
MDFTEFSLHEDLLRGISAAGYVTCTPVQEQMLKTALDGSDMYVQSQTGTGKTAAYLIPILQELLTHAEKKQVLVLLPTRELAVQVEEEAKTLTSATSFSAFSFYGGVGYEKQIKALKNGVDIIIGTPGRMIDLQEGGQLDLSRVGFLVVDEADRMFDMGFYPDLRKLLKVLPKAEERQTMLFSATLNSYVKNLAWEYTLDAKEITIESDNITVDQIDQELLHVSSDEKMQLLVGILSREKPESVLIFCNTKRMCEIISKRLNLNGFKSEFIIGDLPQSKRLHVLNQFKGGSVSILVATDVAARGIDVHDLAMVVNYDLPNESENYVHRIGRTARAGKSGKAYTFCSEQDVYNLPPIERYIEMQIPARVADGSLLGVDKSAGVYIRTENWREDYDDGTSHAYGDKGRNGRRGEDKRRGNMRSGNARRATSERNFDKKRGARTQLCVDRTRDENARDSSLWRMNDEDAEKLQSMSFEDRMKLYKEKYANRGASSEESEKRSGKKKRSKPHAKLRDSTTTTNLSTRNDLSSLRAKESRKNKKRGNRLEFSRVQSTHVQNSAHKNQQNGNAQSALQQKKYDSTKKGLQSRSLWSKVKSLFGK